MCILMHIHIYTYICPYELPARLLSATLKILYSGILRVMRGARVVDLSGFLQARHQVHLQRLYVLYRSRCALWWQRCRERLLLLEGIHFPPLFGRVRIARSLPWAHQSLVAGIHRRTFFCSFLFSCCNFQFNCFRFRQVFCSIAVVFDVNHQLRYFQFCQG